MPHRHKPHRGSEESPGDKRVRDPAATGTGGHQGNGRRDVLVVEDDPEINELVGAYARLAGFEYRAALDGATALAEVRRLAPAVIVLDLMLPDIDGFEICRRIKGELGRSDVPVIILTALDNKASRRQGLECGATEYLTKPFDPDRLIDTICRCADKENGDPKR
jgi:DNA-binding response OmpR family regulator